MTVYVVGHSPRTGPVKIGFTGGDIQDRLIALRRGESCPLAVTQRFNSTRPPSDLALLYAFERGTRHLERELHLRLREHRIEGEWFSLGSSPAEVVKAVSDAASGVETPFQERLIGTPRLEIEAPPGMAWAGMRGYVPDVEVGRPTPPTPEQVAAARHHELFTAWMDAGFTEGQSLKMVAWMVTNPG